MDMTREEKLKLKHSIKEVISKINELIDKKEYSISEIKNVFDAYFEDNDKYYIFKEMIDRLNNKWTHLNKIDNKYPFIDEEYQDMDVMELIKMKNLQWYNYYQDRKHRYNSTYLTQLEYEYKNGKYDVWISYSCNSGHHNAIYGCDDLKSGVLECLNDASKPGWYDDF